MTAPLFQFSSVKQINKIIENFKAAYKLIIRQLQFITPNKNILFNKMTYDVSTHDDLAFVGIRFCQEW